MADPTSPRRDHREPLWDRIDANRVKVGAFVALFVLGAAASLALMVGVAVYLIAFFTISRNTSGNAFLAAAPYLTLGAFVLGAALAIVHVARVLTHPEEKLPGMFGAVPVMRGTLPATESALKDMSIAVGRPDGPWLWMIEDCDRVNAFALGLNLERTIVGVTRGFVDRLSADDQRAVFANLMARARAGDTLWATALSAIMGPIWSQRAKELRRDDLMQGDEGTWTQSWLGGFPRASNPSNDPEGILAVFILGFVSVVLTELLTAGHERAALAAAEKADAEGMLLLKDPQQMLVGLADVLEADNTVPTAGEAYSMLFFCWAGFGYAPEDDPEMRRLGRLREVLGAAGADTA
jgi:Zn-dependent protease with chaperone function